MSDPAERAKAAANLKAGRAKPSWRANVAAAMRARSKLTIDKVRQIHVMAAAGALHKDIANALGVGRTTVTAILRGANWSDVWLEFNPCGTPKSAKP